MKASHFLYLLLLISVLMLSSSLHGRAQSPPGWAWAKQMGAYVGGFASSNDVAGLGHDAAGNLYLLGTYVGTPQFDNLTATNLGGADVFLAKYSPAGTLLWLRTLQSTGNEAANALVVEPSGRCTVAGFFGSRSGGNLALTGFTTPAMLPGPAVQGLPATNGLYGPIPYLVAVDAAGTLLWADVPSPTYGLVISRICRDGSGNCYLSATLDSQAQLSVNGLSCPAVGTTDAALIKYTAAGQPAWARRVGVTGSAVYEGGLLTDAANVYWLLGHSQTLTVDQATASVSPPAGALSLLKLSADNRVRWLKTNLLRIGADKASAQLVTLDAATSSLYLSAYSSGGAISFDGPASPLAVPANTYTTCVARCDTAGAVQWVKPVVFANAVSGGNPNPLFRPVQSVISDDMGYTLVTTLPSSADTRFAGSPQLFGPAAGGQVCVGHFTPGFQAEWLRVGGVAATWQQPGAQLRGSAVDAVGNVFVAGSFAGTANFGPFALTSSTSVHPDIFLAKLDQSTPTATLLSRSAQSWSIYPNPATGIIQLVGLPAAAQLRLFDLQGRMVRDLGAAGAAGTPHSLQGLSSGFYLVQVSGVGTHYSPQRLVVQ